MAIEECQIYPREFNPRAKYYTDVIVGAIASQITSLTIVYSIVYSDADQTGEFPAQMASNAEIFPFDDVTRREML